MPMSASPTRRRPATPTKWPALVKERTEGRVDIQVFPNSQLGGVGEMVDGIKSGAIAMGHHDFASLGKILP